jgi:hypothetical protein
VRRLGEDARKVLLGLAHLLRDDRREVDSVEVQLKIPRDDLGGDRFTPRRSGDDRLGFGSPRSSGA